MSCQSCAVCLQFFVYFWELFRRTSLRLSSEIIWNIQAQRVFDNFMCRSHFLVQFRGHWFNCFLKSIRRSIPMTVAVKLTSTRRCMTCSFFRGVFCVLSRERSGCMRRGHCAAQWEVVRNPRAFSNAPHSWSYFVFHSQSTHSNFEFNGWNQFVRVTVATDAYGERDRTMHGVEWIMEY